MSLVGLLLLVVGVAGGGLSTTTQSGETCPESDPLCGMDMNLQPIMNTVAGGALLLIGLVVLVVVIVLERRTEQQP